MVFDKEEAGGGCSTRNGGQVGTSIKPSRAALARTYGEERAAAILGEGETSLAWLGTFIREEGIDCGFRVSGRFHGAHSPRQFESIAREFGAASGPDSSAQLLQPGEQHREIGTSAYHGGVIFHRHAALDPARYHCGLLERALGAGVEVVPQCHVTSVARSGSGYRVTTAKGEVTADNVVIATNGYTGPATPWLQRRIIPIGSYIIATEPLPRDLVDELLPTDRMVTDTRKVVYSYRASPDRTRILFGGRVSWNETDPRLSAPRLQAEMGRIFPRLAGIPISHSWMGFVAYTFDTLMHIGRNDGVHYAMGYCGSGVGMASYLGMKLGLQALGRQEGLTAFDGLPFPTRPYYFGRPWFLAPAITWYRWRDRAS